MYFHRLFGLAGVDPSERRRARIVGRYSEYFRLLVMLCVSYQWHMEMSGKLSVFQSHWLNCFVWAFFVVDTIVLRFLVEDPDRYLKQNWGNLFFILIGLPIIWNYLPVVELVKPMRVLFVIWLAMPWIDVCRRTLSDNHLGTSILTALIVIIFAGVLISGIDPAISTPYDGIWWAWVTVSTVGYGDIVPISGIGRLFAAVLILMGLALFAVLTANFSAFFIQKGVRHSVEEVKKESEDIRQILKSVKIMKKEEDDILHILKNIEKRLDRLERKR